MPGIALRGRPGDPVEEEIVYLKGSPRIALDLANPFDRYIFIERDAERLNELETLRSEYGATRRIEIRPGDANEELLAFVGATNKRSHRGFIFLDPFGVQVPWSTIEAIARTGALEVMINFPMGMALRRMMPISADFSPGWKISLDAFFGSTDWKEHAYEETIDLAGAHIRKHADSDSRLLEWYCGRLNAVFGHVSTPMLIKNTRGGHLYYLIWAGPRPEGLKGADYILSGNSKRRPNQDHTVLKVVKGATRKRRTGG